MKPVRRVSAGSNIFVYLSWLILCLIIFFMISVFFTLLYTLIVILNIVCYFFYVLYACIIIFFILYNFSDLFASPLALPGAALQRML